MRSEVAVLNTDSLKDSHKSGFPWRLLILIVTLVITAWYVRYVGLGTHLNAIHQWILGLGSNAPLAAVGLFIVGVIAAVPITILMVVTAAIFEPPIAIAVISVGSAVGAAGAFLIARYVLGQSVIDWLKRSSTFRRVDDLTHSHGAATVLVTRLIPIIPMNAINYCWGLTRVRFATYVFFTWIGMLPEIVVLVSGVRVVERAMIVGKISHQWLAILVVTLVLLILIAKRAARYLGFTNLRQLAQAQAETPSVPGEAKPDEVAI